MSRPANSADFRPVAVYVYSLSCRRRRFCFCYCLFSTVAAVCDRHRYRTNLPVFSKRFTCICPKMHTPKRRIFRPGVAKGSPFGRAVAQRLRGRNLPFSHRVPIYTNYVYKLCRERICPFHVLNPRCVPIYVYSGLLDAARRPTGTPAGDSREKCGQLRPSFVVFADRPGLQKSADMPSVR